MPIVFLYLLGYKPHEARSLCFVTDVPQVPRTILDIGDILNKLFLDETILTLDEKSYGYGNI